MTNSSDMSFVRLRTVKDADLKLVLSWRNHPDVRRHMYNQNPINMEEHLLWFKGASVDPERWMFILEIRNKPFGYVTFHYKGAGEAVWGFYLAPDAPGGAGRILGKAATDYAFRILGLKKIWGEVLSENQASKSFHSRHGFSLESVVPEITVGAQKIKNVFRYFLDRDSWVMGKEL